MNLDIKFSRIGYTVGLPDDTLLQFLVYNLPCIVLESFLEQGVLSEKHND